MSRPDRHNGIAPYTVRRWHRDLAQRVGTRVPLPLLPKISLSRLVAVKCRTVSSLGAKP